MCTHDAAPARPKGPGSFSQAFNPIRNQLIAAAIPAAVGAMLVLVPLASVFRTAKVTLNEAGIMSAQCEARQTLIVSLISLFAGMALVLTALLANARAWYAVGTRVNSPKVLINDVIKG